MAILHSLTALCVAILSLIALATADDAAPKRVAVIGAGAAGASTAYFLRKHADDSEIPVNITVFERASHVGGRSTTVNVFDDPVYPVELGASIFVQVNEHLVNASRDLGLSARSAGHARPRESVDTIGIWDGDQFVFILQDTYSWWNIGKLLWRYGWAPVRTQRLMKATVGKFLRLYDKPLFPFRSLSAAAEAVGLLDTTAAPGSVYLEKNSVSPDFAREIIQASTRVNYGQNLPLIHGLEAMVCMATDGAMAIEGGNWRIFDGMLKAAKANVRANHAVTSIDRNRDHSLTVTFEANNAQQKQLFDEVVIAGPLQYSDIAINPPLDIVPDEIPYVKLHVTLFSSPHRLSPNYFGRTGPDDQVPETVLTTLPAGTDLGSNRQGVGPPGFWSISTLQTAKPPGSSAHDDQDHYVYKIFSPEQPTAEFLRKILGLGADRATSTANQTIADLPKSDVSWFHEKIWNPYPFLYPRVTFEDTELSSNIWYTGGIESFISTMETSALMGHNVATLISQSWEDPIDVDVGDDPVVGHDDTEL
ncbi:putative prenylcysteine lyase [Aspergillus taichungensis]|uniref:Putative prenylcysteine lyase n=1 Tax=Aspergillus taichungensis TaxID=482145 RepID=A0A2J5I0F8_9EURO|nr:putative prenylcysteine lyase [Aspergillus taichungensis]